MAGQIIINNKKRISADDFPAKHLVDGTLVAQQPKQENVSVHP